MSRWKKSANGILWCKQFSEFRFFVWCDEEDKWYWQINLIGSFDADDIKVTDSIIEHERNEDGRGWKRKPTYETRAKAIRAVAYKVRLARERVAKREFAESDRTTY